MIGIDRTLFERHCNMGDEHRGERRQFVWRPARQRSREAQRRGGNGRQFARRVRPAPDSPCRVNTRVSNIVAHARTGVRAGPQRSTDSVALAV
jgi:hypothetical protein